MTDRLLFFVAQVQSSEVNIPKGDFTEMTFTKGLQIASGIAGGIALLIVTLAGFKYVVSQGNPQETAKAKNTIIGALIGVVVSITAYGIVTFVIRQI